MGNDRDEKIRKYYNEPAINHIISEITVAHQEKFNLIEEFTEHIKKKSKSFLEEGNLNELKCVDNKIYFEKPREIKLKGINSNENGLCNFFLSTIEPHIQKKFLKKMVFFIYKLKLNYLEMLLLMSHKLKIIKIIFY